MIPGEYDIKQGDITLNDGRATLTVNVALEADCGAPEFYVCNRKRTCTLSKDILIFLREFHGVRLLRHLN